MKDVRFKDNETNVEFLLRTSAIIYDSSKTKILLFHPLKRKVYMLPGGKVEQLEQTKGAIEREIYEELGWKLEFEFVGISEEFLLDMNEKTYLKQLFGENAYFQDGFTYLVSLVFILSGIAYGIGSKSIKNDKEIGYCYH